MNENEVSKMVLDCCFNIHRNLGPGLFESVYEQILAYELSKKELKFKRQNAIPLNYGDIKFNF
jgi:GxxExxY protein